MARLNVNYDVDSYKSILDKIIEAITPVSHHDYSIQRGEEDENGITTEISVLRKDGTLYLKSVLSEGESPAYTKRTLTEYDSTGEGEVVSYEYTLSYDENGKLLSETIDGGDE